MTSSIDDVAKRAGVSIATVSRSLRGLPDVAAATRTRVLAAAAELDYVASPFAARLASGRTATVGVVMPFVNRWYFAEVLGAVETVLAHADLDLLLFNVGTTARRQQFFDRLPVRKRVDGVLVVGLLLSEPERAALAGLEIPIASLGVDSPGLLSASIDDLAGSRLATEHLIERGRRRIARIGGDIDDPMNFTPHIFRRRGYQEALTAAGLPIDERLQATGYYTVDGGESAMAEILARSLPDAVFAESDEMAYGAQRAIRRAGRRIPTDIALIGFDDHASAALMDLSTVRQPVVRMATELTQTLIGSASPPAPAGSAVNGGSAAPRSQRYPVELIVRGSSDPDRSVYWSV